MTAAPLSYMGNISPAEVAKMLNEIQHTRRYRPKVIDRIYRKNLHKLGQQLDSAGLLRSE